MYRSRPFLWLAAGISIFCIYVLGGLVSCITYEPPVYNVYCDVPDNLFVKNVSDVYDNDFDYNPYNTQDGSDIIIKLASNEQITGYKKYSNYIYSPVVLFARNDCLDDKSGFTVYNPTSQYSSTAYKDLYPILTAIEDGKQFADIGISKNVATGPVRITLPAKNSAYYNTVVDVIYATLNDGIPTETQRKELEPRVNKILDACTYVEDISSTICNLYQTDNKDYALFLAPENAMSISSSAFNTTNRDAWMSVYLTKTLNVSYDVFIRDCDMHDAYFSSVSTKVVTYAIDSRIYNASFSMSNCINHTADSVTLFK